MLADWSHERWEDNEQKCAARRPPAPAALLSWAHSVGASAARGPHCFAAAVRACASARRYMGRVSEYPGYDEGHVSGRPQLPHLPDYPWPSHSVLLNGAPPA